MGRGATLFILFSILGNTLLKRSVAGRYYSTSDCLKLKNTDLSSLANQIVKSKNNNMESRSQVENCQDVYNGCLICVHWYVNIVTVVKLLLSSVAKYEQNINAGHRSYSSSTPIFLLLAQHNNMRITSVKSHRTFESLTITSH